MIRTRLVVLILAVVGLAAPVTAQPGVSTVTVSGTVLKVSLAADRLRNGEIGEVSAYLTLHHPSKTLPIKCPSFNAGQPPLPGHQLCWTALPNDIVRVEGKIVLDSTGLEPRWVIVPVRFERRRQE